MAEKKSLSLSDILNSFKSTMEKTAEGEMPAADPAAAAAPVEAAPAVDSNALAEAAQLLEATDAQATAEVADAAQTLQQVADEFIAQHTDALGKEAALFGQIFAASCMEEMNKTAALNDRRDQAYAFVMDAASPYTADGGLKKEAQEEVCRNSYFTVMAKIAGYDDPEELEAALGRELTPEDADEIAAMLAAEEEAAPAEGEVTEEDVAALAQAIEDGELTDEEIDVLAEALAAEGEAPAEGGELSPEEMAAVANGEKVASDRAHQTYNKVLAALGK